MSGRGKKRRSRDAPAGPFASKITLTDGRVFKVGKTSICEGTTFITSYRAGQPIVVNRSGIYTNGVLVAMLPRAKIVPEKTVLGQGDVVCESNIGEYKHGIHYKPCNHVCACDMCSVAMYTDTRCICSICGQVATATRTTVYF